MTSKDAAMQILNGLKCLAADHGEDSRAFARAGMTDAASTSEAMGHALLIAAAGLQWAIEDGEFD